MTAPTTLETVECFLPDRTVTIADLADYLGLRRAEIFAFSKFYGLRELRHDPELTLFDLVLPPARQALKALPDGAPLRYLAYAHTIPTVAPPHLDPAQLIRDELGLTGTESFSVSQQACVSGLAAIDLVATLLRAEHGGAGYALVVTGERAFNPFIQLSVNAHVMADAGAACLVTIGGRGDVLRSNVAFTSPGFSAGLLMTEQDHRVFGAVSTSGRIEVMRRAVAAAGLEFADVDLVLPHNVNAVSWHRVINEMGIPPEKVFLDNVPRYSHCFSSDPFINYVTLRETNRLVPGHNYLFAAVGIGATFGAGVFTHGGQT